MICPAVIRVAAVCALTLCLSAYSQTRSIQGMVSTSDGLPVGRASVGIDGRVIDTTGDSGGFHTPLQPPLRVGFPVVFTVTGWVIIDPCSGDRGREYLPDPDAPATRLRVLRPRDPLLLKGIALTCLLEIKASHLPAPKKTIPGVPGASFRTDNHTTLANAAWPWPPGISIPTASVPPDPPAVFHLLAAAYHPPRLLPAFQSSAASSQLPAQADDTFLAEQAKELGFSAGEINAAITKFSKSVDDPWQKGLAALYEGRYPEAADLIRKSIDAAPSEIDRYVSLGYAEYMQGHYAAAETALRKVLAVHPDDPMLLTNLGTILGVEGKNGEAETDLKRAISLNEMSADLTATAQSRSLLGSLYFQEGNFSLAEEQIQKALELDKKADDPAAYGTDYQNLAMVFSSEGRFAETGTMARNALNAHQTVFGGDHPALVMDLFYQALAANQQGKPLEAEQSVQHALKILRDSGLAGGIAEVDLLIGLGNVYNLQYRPKEALTQFAGALQIVDKMQKSLEDPLGPDARALRSFRAAILGGTGNTYYRVSFNLPAAESAYEQALSLMDTPSPTDAPLVASNSQSLAEIYVAEGQPARAEPLYRHALQILTQRAPDSPQTAYVMTELASLEYESPPKMQEAEKLLSQSLEIKEKLFGKNSPALRLEQRLLARIYCSTGKCQQAEPLIRQALIDDNAKFGENSAMAGIDLGDLGYFYLHCGDPQKAELTYRQAIASSEKTFGTRSTCNPSPSELYANLAASIRSQGGRDTEAQKYDQRAKEISDYARSADCLSPPPQP